MNRTLALILVAVAAGTLVAPAAVGTHGSNVECDGEPTTQVYYQPREDHTYICVAGQDTTIGVGSPTEIPGELERTEFRQQSHQVVW